MDTTNFQEIITTSGKPIIVDFWAPWCSPCRMTKPVLEKLALEYADRVKFLSINADDSIDVLKKLQIAGIPTVMAFKDGVEVGRVIGARNEIEYRSTFEALSSGLQIKNSISHFDRILRLIAGALLIIVGIMTGYWLVIGGGVLLAFFGVYDRCPIWAALTKKSIKKI